MITGTAKTLLSEPQRHLVDRMTRLNFGRIEDLMVRNGLPVFEPKPKVVRDIKLGSDSTVRPNVPRPDFELKPQVVDLFVQLSELGDGLVECLEVKNGLPFRLVVQE